MKSCADDVVVMGAGLAGLAAGHALAQAGAQVRVVEQGPVVGGLARTVSNGGFRFDLGGHRLFTDDPSLEALVRGLLGSDCLVVPRKSQILLGSRYIDYPLRPLNALSGLGPATVLRIAADQLRRKPREIVSLEDWVVAQFGRTMFEIYFKPYSEKVWGMPCDQISMDWVAKRIEGLSIRKAFSRGGNLRTLADRFIYPSQGIGAIAERLAAGIGDVLCNVEVTRLHHDGPSVWAAEIKSGRHSTSIRGSSFISTVPLTRLVRMLHPRPPAPVLRAVEGLRFRDLVIVAVMLDRERATTQSWVYFPDQSVRFGRIHEPKNWSAAMAPPGKTLLVVEQFCFRGDETWTATDAELSHRTIDELHRLRIASRSEVIGTQVVRVPDAYPLFAVGYRERCETIRDYLDGFRNLVAAGRGGTFSYLNMDHAMASGLRAAERVLQTVGEPQRRSA